MLSGRFRCGKLLRHFSPSCSGICENCHLEVEDLPHILLPRCPLLQDRKDLLLEFARDRLAYSEVCLALFNNVSSKSDEFVQFLLDPSTVPEVILAAQLDPGILAQLFRVTTTWCYSMNRARLKLLGRGY